MVFLDDRRIATRRGNPRHFVTARWALAAFHRMQRATGDRCEVATFVSGCWEDLPTPR